MVAKEIIISKSIKNGLLTSFIVLVVIGFDALISGAASEISFFEMAVFYFIVFSCLQQIPDGGAFIKELLIHINRLEKDRSDFQRACEMCRRMEKRK